MRGRVYIWLFFLLFVLAADDADNGGDDEF